MGICILRGKEQVFEFANADYLRLVANRPIVGKPIAQALPELEGQGIFELLDKVYTTGEPYIGRSLRTMIVSGEGGPPREVFFDFVYQPMLDDDGQVDSIVVVVFDVTDLSNARREAESASRAKDEFLAMLGHELRNPLAPILTALQLMRLRGGDGAERERTVIERQVHHLVRLVDDLLDVSRVTRGKVTLRRERVELAEVVAKAIEQASPLLEQRGQHLSVEVPRHGLLLDADATRLGQVFSNLLTNAAKYTEPGGSITITGGREGDEVVASVSDNGSGITQEMLPRIFDLFFQERQELDRSQGGLGLGLAIARSLAAQHDGSIHAHSDGRGQGSTFTVRLPAVETQLSIASAVPQVQEEVRESAPVPHRVLIVDDNRDAADVLAEALDMLGCETRVTYDGPSALQMAPSFRPELALLDIGLPVMDGYELARHLRTQRPEGGLQLVAVTGYGQESDRQRSKEAGFDVHLVKPIDFATLGSLLKRLGSAQSN